MEPWRHRPHMPQLGTSSALAPPQPCLPKRGAVRAAGLTLTLILTLTLTLTTLAGVRTLTRTLTLTQVFREPNAMITKSNARVMSLQDGTTRTLPLTPSPASAPSASASASS